MCSKTRCRQDPDPNQSTAHQADMKGPPKKPEFKRSALVSRVHHLGPHYSTFLLLGPASDPAASLCPSPCHTKVPPNSCWAPLYIISLWSPHGVPWEACKRVSCLTPHWSRGKERKIASWTCPVPLTLRASLREGAGPHCQAGPPTPPQDDAGLPTAAGVSMVMHRNEGK